MKKILLVVLVSLGLQTQAQISYCDSIEMSVTSSTPYTIDLTTNLPSMNIPGIITYDWSAYLLCTTCIGTDTTATPHFQVTTGDTVVVCLTTMIDVNGFVVSCYVCDTLVDINGLGGWMFMSTMGNPVAITELKLNTINDNKTYDLLGREIFEIPLGKMYIKNNKKCILTR